MKLIIAGGRNYNLTRLDYLILDMLHKEHIITEVVSGMAKGADQGGARWGELRGIKITPFYPDWEQFGRPAGMIRNRQMADYADAVILFPGGNGTDNMFLEAKKRGLTIFDFRDGGHNG